ncbi:sugar ABC transporter substrate-binding protein [Anaeromicropila herbilytica]|uniref:Maltodextrin-binding protein n=1 Tax=Anaeromicropila herbilytica TaxID=2785025 RepID=A0A7R7IEZ4_9FIRM|nr:maltose ABC transporter substrate-binding protein [Anaeromicropila herbilytica]BCN32644.1 maltose-binding periplasmic protein [Anaeromicropila herbilytica]
MKKNWSKKVLALFIILVMISSLIGCKKKLPKEEEVFTGSGAATVDEMVPEKGAKLVFWTGNKEYGEAIAKAFKEKYGISVSVAQEGMGTVDKIALSGPSGEGADVFVTSHDNFQKGLSSGVFMQLEDVVANDVKSKIPESGINTVMNDGKMYGIPVSIEVNCLFYNKDLVKTPATTFEEIIEGAKTFNDPKNNIFNFLCPIGDAYNEYPFLASQGFQLFGPKGDNEDEPGFDTDEFEKGLEVVASLHDIMPISAADLSNKSSVKASFMEGKVAYYVSGPWDVSQIKKSGMNFGITTLPTYQGKPLRPFAGVQCAYISTFTKYPIASELFAHFLISDEGASILYKEYDGITTISNIDNVEGLAEDPYLPAFVKQFENSVPMPSVPRMSYFWSIMQDIDRAVFDGKLSPAEARKKTIENWKALLATE